MQIRHFENEIILHVKLLKLVRKNNQLQIVNGRDKPPKCKLCKAMQQESMKNDFEQYVYKELNKLFCISQGMKPRFVHPL